MSNASIDSILAGIEGVAFPGAEREWMGVVEALRNAFMVRDTETLDRIRLLAASQGLQPSITNLLLCSLELGEPPSEEQIEAWQAQAAVEYDELVRRFGPGGTG